jgi:hypothetical protein
MANVKRDEHGEYRPDAGNQEPIEPDEVSYVPCNAVLRHTWSRYGERRYCGAMAIETFENNDTETDYEHPEFCKHHQSRAELMKARADSYKTGAWAKTHETMFHNMPPHKRIMANDLYQSLVGESAYDFEMETVDLEIDVRDDDFAGEEIDTLVMEHPVPSDHRMRGKALWFAALDFVAMEDIRRERFRVAADEEHEGRSLTVGERTTFISTDDGAQEIVDEHHLNLPLSRMQSRYEEELQFGGVSSEMDETASEGGPREWVVMLDEPSAQPEAKRGDSSPLHDVGGDDEEVVVDATSAPPDADG